MVCSIIIVDDFDTTGLAPFFDKEAIPISILKEGIRVTSVRITEKMNLWKNKGIFVREDRYRKEYSIAETISKKGNTTYYGIVS